jgi:hypothetical protein
LAAKRNKPTLICLTGCPYAPSMRAVSFVPGRKSI